MKTCNNEHIGIGWSASGGCPLCACFDKIALLEGALRGAATSLRRWRCSRCGCMPTSHRQCGEDLRECTECECEGYEK